ncbi:pseudouridine synthase [Spirochaetia bacterium]|nr:pseudouridine synthase [Spirochaetia bacterium]
MSLKDRKANPAGEGARRVSLEFQPKAETPKVEMSKTSQLRLQAYLAHAGVASRRASEKLITEGRVAVNGRVVTVLGEKVLPTDEVSLDGKPVKPENRLRYLALNKPPEYICSSADPQNRPLALELLPADIKERLYSVGRLDFLSSGLILFTNDGDFAAKIGHPSAEIEKEYLVEATGIIPDSVSQAFAEGITIDGVYYQSREIEKIGRKTLRICLVEGKNREIRRVFSHFHLHPRKLHRIRIGPVLLGGLLSGESRGLTDKELRELAGKEE